MSSNLPPGVTESMIPGNRPEDAEWENFHDWLDEEMVEHGLTPEEAREVWVKGRSLSTPPEEPTLSVEGAPEPWNGCFTGDCPHEKSDECVEHLRTYVAEIEQENLRLREAHPKPVEGQEPVAVYQLKQGNSWWDCSSKEYEKWKELRGHVGRVLHTHPSHEIERMREALEEIEMRAGNFTHPAFRRLHNIARTALTPEEGEDAR